VGKDPNRFSPSSQAFRFFYANLLHLKFLGGSMQTKQGLPQEENTTADTRYFTNTFLYG
jgi:hypothetical protein